MDWVRWGLAPACERLGASVGVVPPRVLWCALVGPSGASVEVTHRTDADQVAIVEVGSGRGGGWDTNNSCGAVSVMCCPFREVGSAATGCLAFS